jgi:hypothetical protein
MTLYHVTLEIDTTTKPDRLIDYCDRMLAGWFGPEATTLTVTPVDTRTIEEEAIDDHNEAVARAHGARAYIRTDGTRIELEED